MWRITSHDRISSRHDIGSLVYKNTVIYK